MPSSKEKKIERLKLLHGLKHRKNFLALFQSNKIEGKRLELSEKGEKNIIH